MVKQVPEARTHADHVAWSPWTDDRTAPFIASGASGEASVKVLSKDSDTGAESLIYRLDEGWSASSIENTVYENLLVLNGVIEADGQTLLKHCYAYRPEGHVTHDVSSPTGATVFASAGAPGELASKIPLPCLDTSTLPWTPMPLGDPTLRYFNKMLRGDEENLDIFYLMRTIRGARTHGTSAHDGPEECFFLEGRTEGHDGVTGGQMLHTAGTYIHRAPFSVHGFVNVIEDQMTFQHEYYVGENEDLHEMNLAAYPVETEAVRALKEGRIADLPKRW